jgi:hypothetical protein
MLLAHAVSLIALVEAAGRSPEQHLIPAYVPRTASLGIRLSTDTVSPEIRLGWEIGLYEVPRNHLVLILHVEAGSAVSVPRGLSSLHQYKAVAGVGYRTTRDLFHVGFHLGLGAAWYRAGFVDRITFPFENRVVGHSELRGQIGLRVTEFFIAGVALTYGLGWETNLLYPAGQFVGGFQISLFADWR